MPADGTVLPIPLHERGSTLLPTTMSKQMTFLNETHTPDDGAVAMESTRKLVSQDSPRKVPQDNCPPVDMVQAVRDLVAPRRSSTAPLPLQLESAEFRICIN